MIDFRTTESSGVIDWIADNSSVAYAILGDLVPVSGVDAPAVAATFSRDGNELATGSGARVMGNPLATVAWLSGHLTTRGKALEEGHVVLTGSLTGHHTVPADSPSHFTADFGALGNVEVSFRP